MFVQLAYTAYYVSAFYHVDWFPSDCSRTGYGAAAFIRETARVCDITGVIDDSALLVCDGARVYYGAAKVVIDGTRVRDGSTLIVIDGARVVEGAARVHDSASNVVIDGARISHPRCA
jgi:hypothetical protein